MRIDVCADASPWEHMEFVFPEEDKDASTDFDPIDAEAASPTPPDSEGLPRGSCDAAGDRGFDVGIGGFGSHDSAGDGITRAGHYDDSQEVCAQEYPGAFRPAPARRTPQRGCPFPVPAVPDRSA